MRDGVTGDARETRSRDEWIVTTDPPSNGDTSNPTGIAARAAGLPVLFTAGVRADAPKLLADCYESATPMNGQVGTKWLVVVRYSDTARFRFPPTKDRTNVGFTTYQDSSAKLTIDFPYFSVSKVKAVVKDGDPPADAYKFIKATTKLDIALGNPQIRVNVNSFTSDDRAKIRGQLNKIHSFRTGDAPGQVPSEPARFVSYDVAEHAEGLWTITYSWIQDPGNAGITVTSDMQSAGILSANRLSTAELDAHNAVALVCTTARLPFYSYVIVPSDGDHSPDVRIVPQYATADITGYPGAHGLPGAPV